MPKRPVQKKESFFEKAEEAVVEKIEDVVEVEQPKKGLPLVKLKINLSNRWVQISIVIILILSIVAFVLAFKKYQDSTKLVGTDGKLNTEAVRSLVGEVADKIVLPPNETPTIATVTDITKLADQPFFRNAKNGDKVLIYGSLRKAILYRPEIHKIIDVAPVNANLDQQPSFPTNAPQSAKIPTATPTAAPLAQKLKVVILNSTGKAGLAKKAGDLLDSQNSDILKLSNAQGEYKKTIIISVSKNKVSDTNLKKLVSKITKVTPTIESLPKDEISPADADVVIILGQDFADAY